MTEKFLIIDGSSLIHRAFYALPTLTNREGVFTNAVYGFTNMILKLIEEEQPEYLVVAFDKGKITFRNEIYKDYKGHRKATPYELIPQFKLAHDLLEALNIAFFELDNYEADDIIGTFIKLGEAEGLTNVVITGDKDLLQLISENTKVLLTRKGISQTESIDLPKLKELYGLEPEQMIELKGLMGDPSDNIPGVPSVGEKTALKLLKEYGNIDAIYENIEQVKGKKLKENLIENKDKAYLSKELATIVCCVPMDIDIEECAYRKPNFQKTLAILKELDFNSLISKFLGEMEPDMDLVAIDKLAFDEFISAFDENKPISLTLELTAEKVTPELIIGIITQGNKATSFDISEEKKFIEFLSANNSIELLVHDYKETYKYLVNKGLKINAVNDILIASYLLDPISSSYEIEKLALEYLNIALIEATDPIRTTIERTAIFEELFANLVEQLKEAGLFDLYKRIEIPLVGILSDMEMSGIKIEKSVLEEMGLNLEDKIEQLTKDIYDQAGEKFNINSPKQLGIILFEKMDLPNGKKTKTGYSTNIDVLEKITHPIGEKIIEYRQLTKLKGTYIDGFKDLINLNTGKIHTTFKQTITATGRLSSVEPNLQNIPIRLEEGRGLRKAFVPSKKENVLLAADYSQIELRVLAHLSEDENLLDAFYKGHDIHTRTASEVFGVLMDNVTPEMRRNAKAVNFGIVYGISDFGLSRDLGITRKEAKKYIDQYFNRYQGVNKYIHDTIEKAREDGYVTTLLNRRRYLPDLFSPNKMTRSFGERTAMNTPIQGAAADIIKLAMIECKTQAQKEKLPIDMLLQVHDELIFECPEDIIADAAALVVRCMENIIQLKVPLIVDARFGINWYEMKTIS